MDQDMTDNMENCVDKFNKLAYFEEEIYKNHQNPIRIGIDPVEKEENKENEENDLMKKLTEKKPIKSYIQISSSGMLKTHVDLFKISSKRSNINEVVTQYFGSVNFLLDNDKINFALYELYKLNGIAEVGYDYIKFYNGDEYIFENEERSFNRSLGTLNKLISPNGEISKQHYYWKSFFNESIVSDFDEDFYQNEVKFRLNRQCFDLFNKMNFKFSDKSE